MTPSWHVKPQKIYKLRIVWKSNITGLVWPLASASVLLIFNKIQNWLRLYLRRQINNSPYHCVSLSGWLNFADFPHTPCFYEWRSFGIFVRLIAWEWSMAGQNSIFRWVNSFKFSFLWNSANYYCVTFWRGKNNDRKGVIKLNLNLHRVRCQK